MFLMMSWWLHAGVGREIQNSYILNYENKAMFLKVPIRGTRQVIHVRVNGNRLDPASITDPLHFKVGDPIVAKKTAASLQSTYYLYKVHITTFYKVHIT